MLHQLIKQGDFEAALSAINQGERLESTIDDYQKRYLYEKLLAAKQFELLSFFAKDGTIPTDIYDYDNFDDSIFYTIFLKEEDEALFDFFDGFISHFTNLNDEVKGISLLGYAFINAANIRIIKALINAGCDINYHNNAGENLIQQLVEAKGYQAGWEAVAIAHIALLAQEGVAVDAGNVRGETPLIRTLMHQRPYLLEVLLEHGADPNCIDDAGNNSFYYAINWGKDPAAYHTLCKYQLPELNKTNGLGETALFTFLAEKNFAQPEVIQDIVKQLVLDGADLYQPCKRWGEDKLPMDYLARKDTTLLKTVLDTGVININDQDAKGNTLLHKVCAAWVYDEPEHEQAKKTYKNVQLLLEYGADPAITNDTDQTALMLASDDNNKVKTVELLMKHTLNA